MKADIVVIGGGIAGAAAAYFLSRSASVILVEREAAVGYHSSGRSAEQFTVGISATTMRRLAEASRAFFLSPPREFGSQRLVTPRGSLTVGRASQRAELERLYERVTGVGAAARYLDRDEAIAAFPALVASGVDGGVLEPNAMDIDTGALLQGYVRGGKSRGAQLLIDAAVTSIEKRAGVWIVGTSRGTISAPLVLNAAGAWVDEVTELAGLEPIGLVPYRRTAFTFASPPGVDTSTWPHVCNVDYKWYVKPGYDSLMGSLAEAVPTKPGDVYPDDMDVAQAIDNIEQDTSFRIDKPLSTWAGLRSFVRDRNPVAGTRPGADGFFWMAGQGGCGILGSPALGEAIAALMLGRDLPKEQRALGIEVADLAVTRKTLSLTSV